MPVNIHGKEYYTVAERLEQASKAIKSIKTEVLYLEPSIMVKATVETDKGTFTGISAANPDKRIEAIAPVEVAETSAVGRALAFAGYAGSEIASADEMNKAMTQPPRKTVDKRVEKYSAHMCDYHKVEMTKKHSAKSGKEFYSHVDKDMGHCFGKGYKDEIQLHQDKLAAERVADDAAKVL